MSSQVWRAHRAVLAIMGLLALGSGCKERAVGSGQDASLADAAGHDAGRDAAVDAAVGPDGGVVTCGGERLHLGFVFETQREPTHPDPDIDDYEVSGTLTYLGPITMPLATNPAFNREAQLELFDGQTAVLQYYVPPGVTLPVELGGQYIFLFRRRWAFTSYTVGLIIQRLTAGIPVLLFVGDAGFAGRAFDPEDMVMSPLKVYVEPRPDCPTEPDPDCGGTLYRDELRFDSSTGGAVVEVRVAQGERATFPVMGDEFTVMNLASTHVDQPCPDDPGADVSYVASSREEVDLTCDPSRFYFWDDQYGIEVGTFCDYVFVCVDDAAQAAAIEQSAPGVSCGENEPECGPGVEACLWDPPGPVDQTLYDELCSVSLLADPPDTINCRTFF